MSAFFIHCLSCASVFGIIGFRIPDTCAMPLPHKYNEYANTCFLSGAGLFRYHPIFRSER